MSWELFEKIIENSKEFPNKYKVMEMFINRRKQVLENLL